MAETAISSVLSRLGELAAREAALLLEVGNQIMLLRDKLEWLQTFIRDADRKRRLRDNEFVGVWVRQTRDVAYEVEDAVDEFFHRLDVAAAARRRLPWWVVWRGCAGQVVVRHGLSTQVGRIERRLDAISKNREEYKLEHVPSATWTSSSTTNLANWDRFDDEEYVVGLGDNMKTLKSYLIDQNAVQRAIIVVSGEGGIGKRTLVYNTLQSKKVQNRFDFVVWYSMPPNTRSTDLLRDIYEMVLEEVPDFDRPEGQMSGDEAVENKEPNASAMLSELLMNYRYLVVVDGIFTVRNYNSLRSALPEKSNGSRLVLIQQPGSTDVERYATPYKPLKLDLLKEEDTKMLFRYRVFGKSEQYPDGFPDSYHNKIFKITQGLPLAIVVLAGLLRSKEMPAEWDTVLQELLPVADDKQAQQKPQQMSKRVLLDRLLSQSFDDLPHNLKSCFLYLAVFEEGADIEVEHLIRLWTAEGFIRPHKGKSIEEVAHSYLDELLSRCLVREEDNDAFGDVITISIHKRLLAFARSEAEEAGFLQAHDRSDVLSPATVRRLALQNCADRHVPLFGSFPKLRSFVCNFSEEQTILAGGRSHHLNFLHRTKFLRVLDLEGLTLWRLPSKIGDMIHLRYLRLKCPLLVELPQSIANLFNLQTLDVRGTQVEAIAHKFWSITTLRHVLASKLSLPSKATTRHVTVLNNFQTLSGVVAPAVWPRPGSSPLENMPALRLLELGGLTAAYGDPLVRALNGLERLVHVHLEGKSLPSKVFTLQSLFHLRSMELHGKLEGSALPPDVHHLRPNLAVLVLEGTHLRQEFIDRVANMASLTVLELRTGSYDGTELVFPDHSFEGLETLELVNLPELNQWTVKDSALPKLKDLSVEGCRNLMEVPKKIEKVRFFHKH